MKGDNSIASMPYMNPSPTIDELPYKTLFFDDDFRIGYHQLDGKNQDNNFHTHSYYEFELVLDGQGINNIMSNAMEIKKGHFFFLSPSAFHSINALPDNYLTVLTIKLRNNFSEYLLNLFGSESFADITLSSEKTDEIYSIVTDALSQIHDISPNLRSIYMKNTIKNILLLFASYYRISNKQNIQANESNSLINSIILDIRQNYSSPITLDSVSEKYGYSPNYISKMIKNATGMTFKNYVNDIKLKTAYNLIFYSDTPFKKIACDVGYENYVSFHNIFMKKFNISPSQLRNSRK